MFYKGFIFTNLTSFTGVETVTSYTGLDGFSCLLFNKLYVDLNEKVDKGRRIKHTIHISIRFYFSTRRILYTK